MSRRATPCSPNSRPPAPPRCRARIELETARERVRAQHAQADALQRQLEAERAAAEEAARLAVLRQHQVEAATERARGAARGARLGRPLGVARRASRWPPPRPTASKQNEELGELRRNESTLRERLAALNENVHGLEMQAYEKKLHLSTLLERAAEELGLDEDVLVAEYGPEVPVPVDADLSRCADVDATETVPRPTPTTRRIRCRQPRLRDQAVRPRASSRRASPPPSASTRSSAA